METNDQQNPPKRPDEVSGGPDVGGMLFAGTGLPGMIHLEELQRHYARQLHLWGVAGGRSIKTELVQMPGVANGGTALMRAEVTGRSGRFVGYGSASAAQIGSHDPGKLLECAELLAKLDALAPAVRITPLAQNDQPSLPSASGERVRSRPTAPFAIPPELAARHQLDLTQPPRGEGAKIYQYFHQLIGQMKLRSRQLADAELTSLDQVAEKQDDLSFYTYQQALLMVSHAIEDEYVQKQLVQPFYAGFQYFSRLLPQEPRYRTILRMAQRVVIFGLADASLWFDPHLECVAIDPQSGTGLERFWIVATQGPTWISGMLAEHLAGSFTGPLAQRQYQGFWTFDPVIVERIIGTLEYARSLMSGAR